MIIDANGKEVKSYAKQGVGLVLTDSSIVKSYQKEVFTAMEINDLRKQVEDLKALITERINT